METTKLKYNMTLQRFKRAELYMADDSVPLLKRLNHVETLQSIIRELNELLGQIGTYTQYELLNGFSEDVMAVELDADNYQDQIQEYISKFYRLESIELHKKSNKIFAVIVYPKFMQYATVINE